MTKAKEGEDGFGVILPFRLKSNDSADPQVDSEMVASLDAMGGNLMGDPGEVTPPKPKFRLTRLNTAYTPDDYTRLGGGNMQDGMAKVMGEISRLMDEGTVTPDTRPLGVELDQSPPTRKMTSN